MKRILKEYLPGQLKNQQGAFGIATAVGISLISLIGAAVYYDVPEAVDEYAASLTRMRNEEPTNEDLIAFHNSLDALRNAAGGLPIPSDASDVLALTLGQAQGYALDTALAEPPPPAGTGLSGGCSMTLSTTNVLPGDTITATLTTPTLLHSKIGNISCEAGVVGFGISIPGGTSAVGIPSEIKTDSLIKGVEKNTI